MINARRAKDDGDDLALCLGVPARTEKDTGVDEMGRSRFDLEAGPSSTARCVRREDRGARRIKRRNAGRVPPNQRGRGVLHRFDTSRCDAEDYRAAQHNLERRVVGLLEDVKAEDFRYPEKGLAVRFGDWRRRYEEEYVSAFGGLSMVQAWAFWLEAKW